MALYTFFDMRINEEDVYIVKAQKWHLQLYKSANFISQVMYIIHKRPITLFIDVVTDRLVRHIFIP